MSIKYALFPNHLTTDPNDFTAHVETTGSAGPQEVAQRIIDQGSTVTSADILAVLEDVAKANEALLAEGYLVNLPGIAILRPTIKGIFDGPKDKYDPSRHQVDVGATPGARIRKYIRENAKVHKDEAHKPAPDLIEFEDTTSGSINDIIRIGGLASITGYRLQYDKTQADEGIYFVPTDGSPEQKVEVIQINLPGQLVFISPGLLVSGTTCHVEVRTRMRESAELRTGRLDALLTVD